MLKVTNIDAVFAEIDRWFEQVEEEVVQIAVTMSYVALGRILYLSPQYSGDFAANWRMYVNQIKPEWTEDIFPGKRFPAEQPFQRLDEPPMERAIAANEHKISKRNVKLGDTIWVANSSHHAGEAYAFKIEDNLIKLRPVNYGGYAPVNKTWNYLRYEFAQINKSNVEFFR